MRLTANISAGSRSVGSRSPGFSSPAAILLHLRPTNLQQFLDEVRARPGRVNYGTAGVGSLGHVATLLLAQKAQIDTVHIPYRGQAAMTLAVVFGEVQFVLTSCSQAMNEQVEAGKLRRLGVSTPQPSSLAPGAPPIAQVLPGYAAEIWFGLLAPPATPPAAVRQALVLPRVQQQPRGAGMEGTGSRPKAFGQRLSEDEALWRGGPATAGIKPE
jgi:tripartite-type tricarboxylate transporter receptor subunit TctC